MRAAGSGTGSCKVVSMEESSRMKKKKVEEWLRQEMVRKYGNRGVRLYENPMIRICIMFDSLGSDAQYELFGFAKGRILGMERDMDLRHRFLDVLEKGGLYDGSWDDVEELATKMICKENPHVKSLE